MLNLICSAVFAPAAVLLLLASFASAAPTINSPAATPASVPVNTATAVLFTASITDPSITTTGINLQRLDANGNTFTNVGTFYDDATHGDKVTGDQIFSLQLTLTESSPFPITFRVSAPVKGSLTRIFSSLITVNVTGAAPTQISLTAPPSLAFVNSSPVTVSGTVSDPASTVTINGLTAPVTGGRFSIPVAIQEGNNILTASAKNPQGIISTASVQITLDTTPPRISIDAPYDGFATTDSSITVTGKANDTVVGTVNSQQVGVTVNSITATVANRGFQALNIPLSLGNNTIVVTARDRAGNGATSQITVRRDNPTQSVIKIVSGNNQTGAVGATLGSPIIASVVDGAGNPVSGQIIVFAVTQNNGTLDSSGTVEAVTTNSSGQASARWKIGTRSGAGNNIVEATAVGFAGSAIFTASGTAGSVGMISLDAGNDQIGAISQPLPHPFVVVVTDSSHNRLVGVPVTFSIKQGGGNFGGQATLVTNSDSDGRAAAILTLGSSDGIENNVAEATFSGNSGYPAAFSASGHVPGNPAATKITGVVLDNSNTPVPGATIRAYLQNVPAQQSGGLPASVTAQSDLQGQFAIQPAPVGYVKLIADGSTVQRPGKWPNLEYDLVTVSGQNNTIGLPIYLLPLDTIHQLCVSDTQGGTLTVPSIPGFALSVLPGAATFPGGSKTGCVTVTAVHPDKIPMVPGFGQQPRFIVTVQPAGTLFNPPASVTIPNADGLAPREVTEMYSFDHDLATFVSIGSATVSDDGSLIRSDPGVGILKAGWYCAGAPNPAGSATPVNVSITSDDKPSIETGKTVTITATGGPLPGTYNWSSSDPTIATIQSFTNGTATLIGKAIGRATITVTFTCASGETASATVQVNVTTVDVTIISWIDPSVVTLPAGASILLRADINTPLVCSALLLDWYVGLPTDLFGQVERDYANAFLIKNSGNNPPPARIDPDAALAGGDFRLFNRLQVTFDQSSGTITNPVFIQSAAVLGTTPDPCGLLPNVAGEAFPQSGSRGLTSTNTGVYQLEEGRLGTAGQRVNSTINGRTTPYTWSVIRFDPSGGVSTSDHQIFPTHYIYQDGVLVSTIPQSPLQTFIGLDDTSKRLPSQIR